MNAAPCPPDPRTFGAKTVSPAATSAWATEWNSGRSCPSGPPWKLTTVRLAPGTPGGVYSQPSSSVPSSAV